MKHTADLKTLEMGAHGERVGKKQCALFIKAVICAVKT